MSDYFDNDPTDDLDPYTDSFWESARLSKNRRLARQMGIELPGDFMPMYDEDE